MGYYISYNPELKRKYPLYNKNKRKRSGWMVVLFAMAFLLAVLSGNNKGLKKWILPGDPEVTEAALTCFVQDVRDGVAVKEAITDFCLEIINNGEFAQ